MTGRRLSLALVLAMASCAASVPAAQARAPLYVQDVRDAALQRAIEAIAARSQGRIGIAAADLDGGGGVQINGGQLFPMASTAKIAIAATYLSQVEQGRRRLDEQFALLVPVHQPLSARGPVAKVEPGDLLTAQSLMELSITRSDNQATDALLAAVGGPAAVNAWLRAAGITGQHLDHTMATLVRDDGHIDPVTTIDPRTASTPQAMIALLAAIDRGGALSPESRAVLLDTMTRTVTGSHRIRAGLPEGVLFAHKTGTLKDVTNDVGIIRLPDGRHLALAVFVAGPEGHRAHGELIAEVTRAVYDNYAMAQPGPGALTLGRR